MSAKIASMVIKSFHVNPRSPLTERGRTCLNNWRKGKTDDYIADTLFISKDTRQTHIRHIYEITGRQQVRDALIKATGQFGLIRLCTRQLADILWCSNHHLWVISLTSVRRRLTFNSAIGDDFHSVLTIQFCSHINEVWFVWCRQTL